MNDSTPTVRPPERLTSLDAYRGFVMLLMMGEVLSFCRVSEALPQSGFWHLLCHHQSHVEWVGCSLHDLIQPSFSFIVGVALPFSIANRLARGQSQVKLTIHAFWRALILILLGVFLRSTWTSHTNWTFEDTLTQIGLGYGFLFVLGFRSTRTQWLALAAILIGYGALFAIWRLPGADFDWKAAGVSADWDHNLTGLAAHWNKNTNPAWAFDTWFLNLFPREHAFTNNGGGYATLSFIPTLGTMILGLLAGGVLRSGQGSWAKVRWFVIAGCAGLGAGWLLNITGVCPVVKRIWTPGWVLFSGGWCFLLLAFCYAVIDVARFKLWSFPLVVIGMNSIAAYCMAHLFEGFISKNLVTHLGAGVFKLFGDACEPFLHGAAVLFVFWLILLWMYRRKIFLRI
ncbi:MAG: DUF5009 domain-containing protein [Verrucomicrobiota bacterium]|jgi:predicted acyltransferase